MKEIGKVISVVGKTAVVRLENAKEEFSNDIIVKNKTDVKEDETVHVVRKNRLSNKYRIMLYSSPLLFFFAAFGLGFLFKDEMVHYGLMLGLYGISMLIMIMIKVKYDNGLKFCYFLEKIESADSCSCCCGEKTAEAKEESIQTEEPLKVEENETEENTENVQIEENEIKKEEGNDGNN